MLVEEARERRDYISDDKVTNAKVCLTIRYTHITTDYTGKHPKPRYPLGCRGQLISPPLVHKQAKRLTLPKIKKTMGSATATRSSCTKEKSKIGWCNDSKVKPLHLLQLLPEYGTRSQKMWATIWKGQIKRSCVLIFIHLFIFSGTMFFMFISHIASALIPHSFCLSFLHPPLPHKAVSFSCSGVLSDGSPATVCIKHCL